MRQSQWYRPISIFLGFVVDEYLELTEMVKDKAESVRTALGACLQRYWAEIGDVGN